LRRTRIAFVGEARWVTLLAEELNRRHPTLVRCHAMPFSARRAWARKLWLLLAHDIIVRVGMPPNLARRHERLWVWMGRHRRPRLTTFIYWIGTDVLTALRRSAEGTLPEADLAAIRAWRNITGVERLTGELATLGVSATTVPFPGLTREPPAEALPLPARMTVLGYVPDHRRDFYDLPTLLAAARALPDVDFMIAGCTGRNLTGLPPNVRFLGFVEDMDAVYAAASCVVRLVAHDGGGGSVAEGLLAARPVIYSYEWPHTVHVPYRDEHGLVTALAALREQHVTGGILRNDAGRAWALREYDQAARIARLLDVLLSDA